MTVRMRSGGFSLESVVLFRRAESCSLTVATGDGDDDPLRWIGRDVE